MELKKQQEWGKILRRPKTQRKKRGRIRNLCEITVVGRTKRERRNHTSETQPQKGPNADSCKDSSSKKKGIIKQQQRKKDEK